MEKVIGAKVSDLTFEQFKQDAEKYNWTVSQFLRIIIDRRHELTHINPEQEGYLKKSD
jgi:hypothetical protein